MPIVQLGYYCLFQRREKVLSDFVDEWFIDLSIESAWFRDVHELPPLP